MLLLIPQAASCASDHTGDVSDGADSNPQSADSVTASAETDLTDARLSVSDDLPEKDWGGETFLILTHIPEYYCVEEENIPRRSIKEVLDGYQGKDIIILIGPEGDFSKEEAEMAVADV